MDLLAIAELYLHYIFPFVGLLERVISDWDPKFTSKVFQEICALLKVKQNISSAYHPQTDRQSEKTNQYVEMVL
jgi:transposase InsO family protein